MYICLIFLLDFTKTKISNGGHRLITIISQPNQIIPTSILRYRPIKKL